MRTATQLVLVLMGGGALTAGTAVSMESWRACRDARARNDPRVAEYCGSASGGYGHGGFWHSPWFGSGSATSTEGFAPAGTRAAAVRGGFGFAGLHFGGFHG
jgi:hypothetical protein